MSTAVPTDAHLTPAQLDERRALFAGRASTRHWNRAMRVVRRVHLYSGLFLFPWVMLYGMTALLFNHPAVLPDQKIESFPAAVPESPLASLPTATDTARRVVDAIKAQDPDRYGDLEIAPGTEPFYPFGAPVNAKGPNTEFNLSVELTDGSGVLRSRPAAVVDPGVPFAGGVPVSVESPVNDLVTTGVRTLLEQRGESVESVNFRGPPDLYFQVTSNGQTWPVKYSAVNARLLPVPSMSWRQYFLRLHTAHHFPADIGPRWFWALAVDAMFAAMVFWGVSGLLMWWQIKSVRWAGLLTVLAGGAVSLWMAIGMHGAMIN